MPKPFSILKIQIFKLYNSLYCKHGITDKCSVETMQLVTGKAFSPFCLSFSISKTYGITIKTTLNRHDIRVIEMASLTIAIIE